MKKSWIAAAGQYLASIFFGRAGDQEKPTHTTAIGRHVVSYPVEEPKLDPQTDPKPDIEGEEPELP